jgi:hypothetical protein
LKGRCCKLLGLLLFVIKWLPKVDLDIGLDHADLILRFALNDVDQVVASLIVDIDSVAFH